MHRTNSIGPNGQDRGVRFRFDSPMDGWINVAVHLAEYRASFDASFTPRDSIQDFALAASNLATGSPTAAVVFNLEPETYHLDFSRRDDGLQIQLFVRRAGLAEARAAKLFSCIADHSATILAMWRALRALQGSCESAKYQTAWRHEFPARLVEDLSTLIRAGKAG